MRLRSLPLLLLCACLAGSLAGQKEEWRRYKNDAGNFSVLMPAEPEDIKNPDEGESGIASSHTIRAIMGSMGYTVVYVTFSADQKVDEPTFHVFRDSFLHDLGTCRQESEKPASPEVPGYIGRAYRLNCNIEDKQMIFVGNLYWGKRYAYTVMVVYIAAPSDPPGTRKFIDSFAVLGQ